MRVPLAIPKNALKVYTPSEFTVSMPSERGRTIKCEDMTIGEELGPSCGELCLDVIIQQFTKQPDLINKLGPVHRITVYESLSEELPLQQCIELIEDDGYWMRRVFHRWSDVQDFKDNSGNWRKYYLERHLQEYIQEQSPEYYDTDKIASDVRLLAPYIIDLDITELKARETPAPSEEEPEAPPAYCADHFPLDCVIRYLPKLETLRVKYNPKHLGEKFTWELLSMSIEDCRWLGRGIKQIPNLRILCIHRSFLGDKEIQPLLQELATYAPWFNDRKIIVDASDSKILKLPCNCIGDLGARGIAYGLMQEGSAPLKYLDMRLNPLKEEGITSLLSGLIRIRKPETLIIAAVEAFAEGALRIAEAVNLQRSIHVLDITANKLGAEGGEWLNSSMVHNQMITSIDCRETGIPEEIVQKIQEMATRNEERGTPPVELLHIQSEEVIPRVFSFALTESEIALQDAKDAEYKRKREEAERRRQLELSMTEQLTEEQEKVLEENLEEE
ncbi:dynein regulatory complex subunit 5-like [Ctenocephalides felis]|uniref:dynein regulatory complex subunit 5-like n=1 Tax=Ctenocephalides felis TaxID=7515 RepID=UPI000E6E34CE|nr:dynein regulatory complex subunit 5-like [Ctenocephalides felis]